MDQHRGPQSGARVGRTGRQEAEFAVKRIGNLPAELPVQPGDPFKRLSHREAAPQRLQPQMVLLVDEQPDVLTQKHRRAGTHRMLRVEPGQLLAHEMTFMEQLTVHRRQGVQPHEQASAE
jgi:hypothetical protein